MTRMTQLTALVTAIGIVALPPKALADTDRGWFSETRLAVSPVQVDGTGATPAT